jgi:hypothetical protein
LVGQVDWITKRWLLRQFCEQENIPWSHPWLKSQDLEYHQIDPARSLGLALARTPPAWEIADKEITQPPPGPRPTPAPPSAPKPCACSSTKAAPITLTGKSSAPKAAIPCTCSTRSNTIVREKLVDHGTVLSRKGDRSRKG